MENHGIFEKYLSGSMTEGERSDFQKRISEDPLFEKEFRLFNEVNNVIAGISDRNEFAQALKSAETRYFSKKEKQDFTKSKNINKKILFYRVAASIIFVLAMSVLGYFLLNNKVTTKEIYAENYSSFKLDVVSRSVDDSLSNTDNGLLAFQEGNYKECITLLSKEFVPNSVIENLVTGLSFMELKKFAEAEKFLYQASLDETNALHDDCLWYLALTYLQLEKAEKALPLLKILKENNSMYKLKAEKILDELK